MPCIVPYNPAIPPPVQNFLPAPQVELPVELLPVYSTGGDTVQIVPQQYRNPLSESDWELLLDELNTDESIVDYTPHANHDPLQWKDQLEWRDCLVFSGKATEDVVDWMCHLKGHMTYAQCDPHKGVYSPQRLQATKFLVLQCLQEETLKWWTDKEEQLVDLNMWDLVLQGLKKWQREWDEITPMKYGGNLVQFIDNILRVGEFCD